MSLSKWLPCDFAQCHPLLWSGGILVDHWSTISSLWLKKPLPFLWCIIDIEHKKICIMQRQVTSPHYHDMMKLFPVKISCLWKYPLLICDCNVCPIKYVYQFLSCTRWLHTVDNRAKFSQYIGHMPWISEPRTYLWQNVIDKLRSWSRKLSCSLVDIIRSHSIQTSNRNVCFGGWDSVTWSSPSNKVCAK